MPRTADVDWLGVVPPDTLPACSERPSAGRSVSCNRASDSPSIAVCIRIRSRGSWFVPVKFCMIKGDTRQAGFGSAAYDFLPGVGNHGPKTKTVQNTVIRSNLLRLPIEAQPPRQAPESTADCLKNGHTVSNFLTTGLCYVLCKYLLYSIL